MLFFVIDFVEIFAFEKILFIKSAEFALMISGLAAKTVCKRDIK